jgi:hypothetical protein
MPLQSAPDGDSNCMPPDAWRVVKVGFGVYVNHYVNSTIVPDINRAHPF